jgi:hypothetical protein
MYIQKVMQKGITEHKKSSDVIGKSYKRHQMSSKVMPKASNVITRHQQCMPSNMFDSH